MIHFTGVLMPVTDTSRAIDRIIQLIPSSRLLHEIFRLSDDETALIVVSRLKVGCLLVVGIQIQVGKKLQSTWINFHVMIISMGADHRSPHGQNQISSRFTLRDCMKQVPQARVPPTIFLLLGLQNWTHACTKSNSTRENQSR
jgi:hypothetical protein